MNELVGRRRGWRRKAGTPYTGVVPTAGARHDDRSALTRTAQVDPVLHDLTRAVDESPRQAEVYLNRGLAYSKRRQYPLAIRDFTHAVNLDPGLAEAYHNRALAYGEMGDYDRAMADFTHAAR